MPKGGKKDTLYTLEEWHEIVKEWEQSGESVLTFCNKKNISNSAFYSWKKRVDHAFRQELKKQEEESWRRILEEWKEGSLSPKEYCKRNGIRYFAFQIWQRRLDLDHEEENKWKIIIEDWRKSGKSIRQFSKDINVHHSHISKWRNKFYPELGKRDITAQKKQWDIIIRKKKENGLTQEEICKKFGISTDTFSRWQRHFSSEEVSLRAKTKTKEEWKSIIEDWKESGLYITDYCKKRRIGDSTFRAWHRKLCDPLEQKTVKKRSSAEWRRIIEDWDKSGLSIAEHSRQKNIKVQTFSRWMKKLCESGEVVIDSSKFQTMRIRDKLSKEVHSFKRIKRLRNRPSKPRNNSAHVEKWKNIVEDWVASGINKTDFCKKRKLSYGTFLKWTGYFYPEKIKTPARQRTQEEWIALLTGWKGSGLSIKAYCEKHGVSKDAFPVWRKKLAPFLPKNLSPRRSPEEWKMIVLDWKKSGLPLKTYCRKKKHFRFCF